MDRLENLLEKNNFKIKRSALFIECYKLIKDKDKSLTIGFTQENDKLLQICYENHSGFTYYWNVSYDNFEDLKKEWDIFFE